MKYEVVWSETAVKNLERLEKTVSRRILEKVEDAKENPFRFLKKLKGLPFYRLKVGKYRVIMSVEAGKLVIFVVDVGHRHSIYKR